ncbi:universal stress protein [Hephaestia mangrovi]|uniref:universal stress protein n=1 Tax=Hephaestia mangrovi TaxID=2873268 RepID=UPI001CA6970D|nr:universal stress protein [Hephaestia mangrovi]MBY8827380.1 universal stress protein [Hephaestia mangrovi]
MQTILIASDLSQAATPALARACLIAEQHCADLVIFHVARRAMHAADRALLAEELEELAATQTRRHPCIRAITTRLGSGRPSDAIAAEAARVHADLIVVGGHGPMRWGDELFGTTVENLVRHTGRPVLVARNVADRPYRRIVAAIEDETLGRETLALATTMSSADTVFAVHAFLPTVSQLVAADGDDCSIQNAAQNDIEAMVSHVLGQRRDIACTVHAVAQRGDPVAVIARAWAQFHGDLVVAVTHGRTGLGLALRGSLADMLIEEAPFDLLLERRR